MNPNQRNGSILASILAVLGAATLVALFLLQELPEPIWVWVAFAAAFVGLEFSSVEVSDRLYVSGSRMAAFTAAVVFGRGSAVLAVALMAGLSALHPAHLP